MTISRDCTSVEAQLLSFHAPHIWCVGRALGNVRIGLTHD